MYGCHFVSFFQICKNLDCSLKQIVFALLCVVNVMHWLNHRASLVICVSVIIFPVYLILHDFSFAHTLIA